MTLTPWEERQILQDIIDGLGAAIDERDDWSPHQVDDIKFNKLLYLAIDGFELPITYRWYRYGFDVTHHGKSKEDIEPRALSELPSPEEPRIVEEWETQPFEYPSPEEYKLFYLDIAPDLNTIFQEDTKEYLREFYHDYAPEEYEELYVACVTFQKTLDEVGYADDPGQALVENYDELDSELRRLKGVVTMHPTLEDSPNALLQYLEVLQDTNATIHQVDGDLTRHQLDVFKDVITFFYTEAWRFVSLEIAENNNIGGDNRRDLLDTTLDDIEELEKNFDSQLQALQQRCLRADLISDEIQAYRVDEEELANAYTRKADEDRTTEQEWQFVTAEVDEEL